MKSLIAETVPAGTPSLPVESPKTSANGLRLRPRLRRLLRKLKQYG